MGTVKTGMAFVTFQTCSCWGCAFFIGGIVLGRELSKHFNDGAHNLLLLFRGEATLHVLNDGIKGGDVGRSEVEDHDGLPLGDVVWTQSLEQFGDSVDGIG